VAATPVPETPEPVTPEPTAPPPAAPAPRAPAPAPVITPAPAPPPVIEAEEVSGYIWPVSGRLNSRFGPRWGSFHSGIDIGAAAGTAVAAAASGKVILASYSNYGYGNYVIVRHGDGSETLYAHLSRIYVALGQQVGQGETVGTVGCTGWCTGPHLHFEIRIRGVAVDPLPYLP
jgi:murein DD-endopeptidase MepM/ murein hydrolase activator NlpD